MYILSYKRVLSFSIGVKIRLNSRRDISPERPKMHNLIVKVLLSLLPSYGSGVLFRLNPRGGISTERPKT